MKLVNNIIAVLLFCSHFVFWFVFSLSVLKGPTLPWDEIISRLFHLNEIRDFIASSFHSDPDIKMCLGSYRMRKKLDYQFTIICCFSRSRMDSFSIYLAWQMMASPETQTQLLMHLRHKASMHIPLAFPSASLLSAVSRQKSHWHFSNAFKGWFIFTLSLTQIFL